MERLEFDAQVLPGSLHASWVVVSPQFASSLETAHRTVLTVTLRDEDELTREVPDGDPLTLTKLDEKGLIRVGQDVEPGTVLVGISGPPDPPGTTAERFLRTFGEPPKKVSHSLHTPVGVYGVVHEVTVDSATVRVEIRWSRRLEVGDELTINGQPATVAAIEGVGADLAWGNFRGPARVKKTGMARDVLHARFIGPYEPETEMPLRERARFGGQEVGDALSSVLVADAPWTLWEMRTVKADCPAGRLTVYESIVKRENPVQELLDQHAPPQESSPAGPVPGGNKDIFSFFKKPQSYSPETVTRVSLLLAALGFDVNFQSPEIRAVLMSNEQLLKRSQGAVNQDLGSQQIFGPIRNYECECGRYNGLRNRGTVCEVCGVEVTNSKVRRERFGHLLLRGSFQHPILGPEYTLDTLLVPPPHLRSPGDLNDCYEALLAEQRQEQLDELFDALAAKIDVLWNQATGTKPVDYSAIACLIPDPTLEPGQCRIPRQLATELFRPFAYGLLEEWGYVTTIKSAKKMIDRRIPEAVTALEHLATGHPLLLACGTAVATRMPTLWDEPAIAVDPGTALKLRGPQVCVFVPLTDQAQLEAMRLPDFPHARPLVESGWLSRTSPSSLVEKVRVAAIAHESDAVSDIRLACSLGRPPKPPPRAELEGWRDMKQDRDNRARPEL